MSFIGVTAPIVTVAIEAGRLKDFARAVGEEDPLCFDAAAAQAANLRGLRAPPTFLFCLSGIAREEPIPLLREMGGDLADALHGEQAFHYFEDVYAGDEITLETTIENIYTKSTMEFIDSRTRCFNQDRRLVAELLTTIILKRSRK